MRQDLFKIAISCWCATLLGVIVTASSFPSLTAIGAGIATIASLAMAISATYDYFQP